MRQNQAGLALPIVLLFTALVMGLLMSSAAYSVIGAKTRNVSESTSTMALFAAESLLAKIDGQFRDSTPFTGGLTSSDVITYLTSKGLSSLTLTNGATATVSVANITTSSPIVVSLKSTGRASASASSAAKVVLKDYQITSLSSDTAISAPGAMNSRPYVDTDGQPVVEGVNPATDSGVVYDPMTTKQITTATALSASGATYGTTYTLALTDPRNPAAPTLRVDAPGYVELGDPALPASRRRFKVLSKTSSQAVLQPVNTTGTLSFTANYPTGTQVGNIPIAVTAPLGTATYPISSQMTFPVTDAGWFYADAAGNQGDLIYADYRKSDGTIGVAKGRVKATNTAARTITVDFACTGCAAMAAGSTLSEGTPLRREVIGIVGGSNVDAPLKSNYTFSPNDPRIANPYGTPTAECPSGNLMFCSTFKTDYNTFLALNPPVTKSSLSNLSGLTVVNGGNWNGSNGLCGSGILVVIGDFSASSAPQCENNSDTFYGFIYVTGNVTMSGNLSLIGALTVQGNVSASTTVLSGTKNGDKITYSLMTLNDVGRLCCNVAPVTRANSWRQQ